MNLVDDTTTDVVVHGTSAADEFSLVVNESLAGVTGYVVTVNGVGYTLAGAALTTLGFDAGDGLDTATLGGTSGSDSVDLSPGTATLTNDTFTATATDVETITVNGSGGEDDAELIDSTGDDTFTGSFTGATMVGQGFDNTAVGFKYIHAYSRNGGNDTATLYDSAANDKFRATPEFAKMYNSQYFVRARFFETVTAYSTAGGTDDVRMWDSTSADKLISTPTKVRLYNTTDNWDITARMFDTVTVHGSGGLYDVAKLHDTGGDDHLTTNATQATLARTNGTRTLYEVNDFDTVRAYQSTGTDTATAAAAADYVLDLIGDWTPTPSRSLASSTLPLTNRVPD